MLNLVEQSRKSGKIDWNGSIRTVRIRRQIRCMYRAETFANSQLAVK